MPPLSFFLRNLFLEAPNSPYVLYTSSHPLSRSLCTRFSSGRAAVVSIADTFTVLLFLRLLYINIFVRLSFVEPSSHPFPHRNKACNCVFPTSGPAGCPPAWPPSRCLASRAGARRPTSISSARRQPRMNRGRSSMSA